MESARGEKISRPVINLNHSFAGFTRVAFALLLFASFSHAQPKFDPGTTRAADLVELVSLDSTIRLDIRYATSNNFMKRPMYAQSRAFLQRPAAEALVRIQKSLRSKSLGLLVFDGYRPWTVTKKFWDETPPEHHGFVADPKLGSKHNRGCAVDLSLVSLRTGKEIVMPSPYDSFTESAAAAYRGGTRAQRKMRDVLRKVMEREGFAVNPTEWWHFDYRDWREYEVLDIPFDQIPAAK